MCWAGFCLLYNTLLRAGVLNIALLWSPTVLSWCTQLVYSTLLYCGHRLSSGHLLCSGGVLSLCTQHCSAVVTYCAQLGYSACILNIAVLWSPTVLSWCTQLVYSTLLYCGRPSTQLVCSAGVLSWCTQLVYSRLLCCAQLVYSILNIAVLSSAGAPSGEAPTDHVKTLLRKFSVEFVDGSRVVHPAGEMGKRYIETAAQTLT